MNFKIMKEEDIEAVIPFYIEYYNNDDSEWTEQTTYKRIHQVLTREDSYCLAVMERDTAIGFVMGYFEQFDDGFIYDLVEIVIASEYQNKGIGTELMKELENRVREKGALNIRLDAVNDEFHEHFYGKLGYKNVSNFVSKTKPL